MHNLTVVRPQETVFKLSTADSSQLPSSEKLEISSGSVFGVLHYIAVEGNHYKVNFNRQLGTQNLNTWYVYRPHIYVEQVTETPYSLYIPRKEGTILKTSTDNSSNLPAEEKMEITGQINFGVLQYEPASRNHYKVTFSGKLGDKQSDTWYVYAPHVSMNPEITYSPIYYTVKSGDSLSKIAERFYGNSAYWCSIYEDNYTVIGSNPAIVNMGLKLRIPSLEGVASLPLTA